MIKRIFTIITIAAMLLASVAVFNTNEVNADTLDADGTVLLFSTKLVNEATWMESNLGIFKGVFEDYGYTVRTKYSKTLEQHLTSEDMEGVNLVVICTPYILLNSTDIDFLESYLNTGGRIVMQGEYANGHAQDNAVLTDAAVKLGGDFTITSTTSFGSPVLVGDPGFNGDSTLLNNVVYGISNGCIADIEYRGSAEPVLSLLSSGNLKPYVVDQAVGNGRITVITDANFYWEINNTNSLYGNDTRTFIRNWLLDSMNNQQTVSEGNNPNAGFGGSPTAEVIEKGTPVAGSDYGLTIKYIGYDGKAIDTDTIGIDDVTFKNNEGSLLTILSADIIDESDLSNLKVRYTVKEPDIGWIIGDSYTVGVVNAAIADVEGVQIGGNNSIATIEVKEPVYSITYNLDEGINSESNPEEYMKEDGTITLEDPTKEGYTFKGWYDNAEFNNEAITEIVTSDAEDKTLYAKWVKESNLRGTVILFIKDGDGNPLVGYKGELHSDPIVTYTDALGRAIFNNVELTNHTLIIMGEDETVLSTLKLSIIPGESNITGVNGNEIDVVYGPDAISLDIEITVEDGKVVIDKVTIITKSEVQESPMTGDFGISMAVILIVIAVFSALAVSLNYKE